jgi:hypothetical protein
MDESADGLGGAGGAGAEQEEREDKAKAEGPDPVIGAGLALFGIFVMGLGGARDMHFVFNAGMFVAIAGAAVFVLFVALSAMKQRSSRNTKSA